jgi:hypothetical protein
MRDRCRFSLTLSKLIVCDISKDLANLLSYFGKMSARDFLNSAKAHLDIAKAHYDSAKAVYDSAKSLFDEAQVRFDLSEPPKGTENVGCKTRIK